MFRCLEDFIEDDILYYKESNIYYGEYSGFNHGYFISSDEHERILFIPMEIFHERFIDIEEDRENKLNEIL